LVINLQRPEELIAFSKMKKFRSLGLIPKFFILTGIILFASQGLGSQEKKSKDDFQNLDQALKIINFLEQVAAQKQQSGRFQGKTAQFLEQEVSAFFTYLFSEQVSTFRAIELKFFPGNKVEGRVLLDLSAQALPAYFKPELNLYFAARIEISGRKVRLNYSSLYLETQRIQPEIIDSLISLVAKSQGLESRSLESWYELPEGVENLETGQGRLIVHY